MLPCDQGVEVVEDGGVVVGCPAVGMGLDVALQVEQGDEPFAFACAIQAALQLGLGLLQEQGDNRQLGHAFDKATHGQLRTVTIQRGKLRDAFPQLVEQGSYLLCHGNNYRMVQRL